MPVALTDPIARARHLARADLSAARFAHDAARAEIQEKLRDVNRRFTDAVIITPMPEFWADLVPEARVVAPNEVLDLSLGAHDLVIHAMALHWADDPVGQIVQCARALRPDGLFLSVSFGGTTLAELRAALGQAEIDLTGGLSPRIAPMAEMRDLGGLLQRAGLALPVADNLTLTATYADFFDLTRDLRAMGERNALAERHRHPPPRRLFAHAADIYAARFSGTDGRLIASFELIFLTGWAPDLAQPKPLRPGSAQKRLAEALGTTEFDPTAGSSLDALPQKG